MGGVGGKAPLGLEGRAQPLQQRIHGGCQRCDLARQVAGGDRGEVLLGPGLQLVPEGPQRTGAPPYGEGYRHECSGDNQQDRKTKAHLHLADDGVLMRQRLRHRDADRALQGLFAVEAVSRGPAEAGSSIGREGGEIGRVRPEQNLALVVSDHVGEELVVASDRPELLAGDVSLLPSDDVEDR